MSVTRERALRMGLLITGASVAAKVLGFLKDVLISYHYGAGALTDAVFLAMSVPTMVLGVFTSAADSAIVPQYNRLRSDSGRQRADQHFSRIVLVISCVSLAVSLLLFAFPQAFISVFAPGFSGIQRDYASSFLRLFSFFGVMHVLYCFFSAYNTAHSHIGVRAVLSFSTNILVIMALLIKPDPRMRTLAVAYFVGNILSALLPVSTAAFRGYRFQIGNSILDDESRRFVTIFLPIAGSALLVTLNTFVDKFLASGMGEGSISALTYASRLTGVFDNLLVVGLGVVILPALSSPNIRGDLRQLGQQASRLVRFLIMAFAPIFVICLALSSQIVEAIYMRGQFGTESVKMVSSIFLCYAPLVLSMPLQATLTKVFHAIEDTKTPFLVNVLCITMNAALSVILSQFFGLRGIAFATSVSVVTSCVLLWGYLSRKVGRDNMRITLRDLGTVAVCAALAFGVVRVTVGTAHSFSLFRTLEATLAGFVCYAVLILAAVPGQLQSIYKILSRGKQHRRARG